jgi:succinate dehydrogenase / fumarate reductase flavoprotein subunit
VDIAEVDDAVRCALALFERGTSDAAGPYQVQQELQSMMQTLVGIVRTEPEMKRALQGIDRLKERARQVGVTGNREYNPGWHTGLDLPNLLTVSEAITRAAIERRESRGGHFRDDYPEKDPAGATYNIVIRKGEDAQMRLSREPVPEMLSELKRIVQEQK